MEFAKRIGELAHFTRRLSRVQADEARSRKLIAAARNAPRPEDGEEARGLRLSLARQRISSPAAAHQRAVVGCVAAQNQLLLRRIPLSVSLVERSWWKLDCRQKERAAKRDTASSALLGDGAVVLAQLPGTSPSAPLVDSDTLSTPPARGGATRMPHSSRGASAQQLDAVVLLLQLLHGAEEARRRLLREKEAAAQRRVSAAQGSWQDFRREFAPQLRRHAGRHTSGTRIGDDDLAVLRDAADSLQHRCRAAKDDALLLRESLLARPYVSARLWRLLLRDSIWAAAVVEHRRAAAAAPATPLASPATRLLLMCVALARLSMGILRDYVEGKSLSQHAPRFVVSLPSRAWRARSRGHTTRLEEEEEEKMPQPTTVTEEARVSRVAGAAAAASGAFPALAEGHEDGDDDGDALFAMLHGAAQTASSPAAAGDAPSTQPAATKPPSSTIAGGSARSRKGAASMRWMPAHAAQVIPLITETLALFSHVLPELDVPALLRLDCAAELSDLCVTLQRVGSTLVTLAPPPPAPSPDGGTRAAASLPRTLGGLEAAIAAIAGQVKQHLVAQLCTRSAEESASGAGVDAASSADLRLSPAHAARWTVQLHALRLLPVDDADAALLVSQLLLCMFPELRTNTSRVLQDLARQSSLVAFSTRAHRAKLYAHHGRRGAETHLLGTTVQQARLQQRQLAAALREQHMTEVHAQELGKLARTLSSGDLVRLIQLCANHAGSRYAARRHAMPVEALDATVLGCLFLSEALLISGALQASPDAPSALSLHELAVLWDAAALLAPLIRARRSPPRNSGRGGGGGTGPGLPRHALAPRAESILWAAFAEHVLTVVNGALALHVQGLERKRLSESTAMRRTRPASGGGGMAGDDAAPEAEAVLCDGTVTVDAVVSLAAALLQYSACDDAVSASGGGGDGGGGGVRIPSSLQTVQREARVLARLLQEVVLHDRNLWRSLRSLPSGQRDVVERHLVECFQTMGTMDNATARALEALRQPHHIDL
ncbi:hypothetical protein NESM_000316500 [Novymonas esmeraldas]|uniref:Uncharacterized protein n=1 Tax=Novymonas esmeraldas TaxID=1808958 RepID=A0AAW0EK73_9TRYP